MHEIARAWVHDSAFLCERVCLCNGTTRQCECLVPLLLFSLWLSACMHARNNCLELNLQAQGEPFSAWIYSIALYTSLARSSMRAHRWPGFDTPQKRLKQTKIFDLSHTVREIHSLKVYGPHVKVLQNFEGSQLLNGCRYLGQTILIFARLVETFHLSPQSSLYQLPLQSSVIIALGPKIIYGNAAEVCRKVYFKVGRIAMKNYCFSEFSASKSNVNLAWPWP